MSPARKRILRRAGKGLAAVLLGAAPAAVVSPDFREFVGSGPLGALLLLALPPLLLALEKALRDRRAR